MTGHTSADVSRQLKWEQKMYWRNPPAAAFTFALPLVFLVIIVAIHGDAKVHFGRQTAEFAQYYVPAVIAFSIVSACYTYLAFTLCMRRERGILKRARGTPLSPTVYLAAMMLSAVVVSVMVSVLVVLLGITIYGVTWHGRWLGLLVGVGCGAVAFGALGVAVSTFVPNEDAAPAIVNFVLFPLLFISGTFTQISDSSVLSKIAVLFPARPLIKTMVAVFNPFGTGSGLTFAHIGMLLLWGVIGLAVAVRRFRWEPQAA